MRWLDLAEDVMQVSDATRSWLIDRIADLKRQQSDETDERYARRAARVDETVEAERKAREIERMASGARRIYELVESGEDSVGKVRRRMRNYDGDELDRALGHAIDAGWIVEHEEKLEHGGSAKRTLRLGGSRPA